MEQKAAQVFSQQEREQQTRDLKQQDTKLNALTKEEGNVPLSGVAVRKGPKCRISTTKKKLFQKDEQSPKKHTHYRKYKTITKKDPQKRLITGPQTGSPTNWQTERRRTGLYVHRALIRERDTDEGETEEEAISR